MDKKELLQAPDGASEAEDLLDAAAGLVIMRGSDCDRVVAEKIQALKGKPCTCGSGGHPYRCERHPFAYDAHVRELNTEAELANRAEDAEELLRRIRGWDHMDTAADGPYWRKEIDAVLSR